MNLLAHGFDVAFLASFILAVFVLVLSLVIRQRTHPDNQEDTDPKHASGISEKKGEVRSFPAGSVTCSRESDLFWQNL